MIPNPFRLLLVTWADRAVDTLTVAAILAGVFCFAMAALVEVKDRQDRRRDLAPEVPPVPEAPAVPQDFKPRKHKAVKDRLAWRQVHPREADAIARHARQLHFHDAEEAEARHE